MKGRIGCDLSSSFESDTASPFGAPPWVRTLKYGRPQCRELLKAKNTSLGTDHLHPKALAAALQSSAPFLVMSLSLLVSTLVLF